MTHEDLPSFSFQYNQQSPFPAILQMATLKTKKRTRILNVFHLHPKTCASLNHPHVLPSFQSRNLQENWDKLHKDPTTKIAKNDTLQGSNISPKNGILKMIFLFPRWDMLIPWRVFPHLIPSISQHFPPPTPSCLSKVTLPGLALRKLMVPHPSYRRSFRNHSELMLTCYILIDWWL